MLALLFSRFTLAGPSDMPSLKQNEEWTYPLKSAGLDSPADFTEEYGILIEQTQNIHLAKKTLNAERYIACCLKWKD